MDLAVFGLNHRTASVALREKLALSPDQQRALLAELLGGAASEAAILSTCNRVEVYAVCSPPVGEDYLRRLLEQASGVSGCDPGAFYFKREKDALSHLLRVAASLDSQVVGETHVLGQVKECYERARSVGATGRVLNVLFQKAFQAAKQIRTETTVAVLPVSTGSCAVAVATRIFGPLNGRKLLVVGTGQTGQTVARHFVKHGVQLTVSNRTDESAEEFSKEVQARPVAFHQWPDLLASVDIVAFATCAREPLLRGEQAARLAGLRKNRPLLVLDLSVPRNVDPAVSGMQSIFLYDIDAVQSVVQAHQAIRAQEAEKAEQIVAACAHAIWGKVSARPPAGEPLQEPRRFALPFLQSAAMRPASQALETLTESFRTVTNP